MSLKNKLKKFIFYLICITVSNALYSQIYPANFIYNGCNYSYNGLTIGSSGTMECDSSYQLLFEDSFDGSSLDSTNWQTYYPWGRSLNNDKTGTGFERQYYSDDNIYLQDGFLHLKTTEDPANRDVYDIPGYDSTWMPPHNNIFFKYTSGMIYSKLNFKAGKFEMRGKIPLIDGTWPAFWLYGACAQEIDAFEFLNSSTTSDADTDSKNMVMTYHRLNYCNEVIGGQCDNGFKRTTGSNLSNEFHLYSVEWNTNKIIWKLDSVIVREVYRIWSISAPLPDGPLYGYAVPIKDFNDINPASTYTVFNTFPTEDIKMNIILNTAVAFERGSYPKEFIVDYVKVYTPSGDCQIKATNFSLINIYPNPSTGKFSISQSDKENPITDVLVFNLLGGNINCSKIINEDIALIDLSNEPKGVYIVKIVCKGSIELKKIITINF